MKKPRYNVPIDTNEKIFRPKRGKFSYSRKEKYKKNLKNWIDLEEELN